MESGSEGAQRGTEEHSQVFVGEKVNDVINLRPNWKPVMLSWSERYRTKTGVMHRQFFSSSCQILS